MDAEAIAARPAKAEFVALYDDGSTKLTVKFDTTSQHCPDSIWIETGSQNWVGVDVSDIDWLVDALISARNHLAVRDVLRGK